MSEANVIDTAAPSTSVAGMGLAQRAIGVIFSPRATYAELSARPRVAGALFLTIVVIVGASLAFFSTEVGREALLDMQVRSIESFGRQVSDEQYSRLEQMIQYAPYVTTAGQIVALPVMSLVLAAIVLAVFNAVLGGDATYKQVLAVVVHSQLLRALQQLFVLPLDYATGSLSSPTSLAVFLPFVEEATFAGRLLGSIDLFLIWMIVSLSIGIGVVYKRRTAPIATTLLLIYAAGAVIFAAARTALSGN